MENIILSKDEADDLQVLLDEYCTPYLTVEANTKIKNLAQALRLRRLGYSGPGTWVGDIIEDGCAPRSLRQNV